MSDQDILEPAEQAPGTTVAFRGEQLVIRPLVMGRIPAFVRAIQPILDDLGSGELDMLALLARHGEQAIAAAAVATGQPETWLADAEADEFLALAHAIYTVNRDFFGERVAPRLSAMLAAITGTGPTPSSSSSTTVIA